MGDKGGFGGRLRQAIEARSLDQKRLAERMDIREATISGWVKGHYMPRLAELLRVVEILDVSADWLLFGVGSMDRAQHENGADSFAAGAAYAVRKMMETLVELRDVTASAEAEAVLGRGAEDIAEIDEHRHEEEARRREEEGRRYGTGL